MKQHLPFHPFTGLQAVYVDKHGTPRYPIMGGSEDGDAGDSGSDGGDAGDDGGDAGSGDNGGSDADNKLAQARQEAIDRRKELKPWKDLGKEFGLTPEQIRAALKDAPKGGKGGDADEGDQPDAEQIRRDAEREAEAKANARIVRAEVRALAAESFANPLDALHNLNLDEYEVNEDGELEDVDAVKSALADVLKKNPHYAKKGKAPKPDPSQGPRGGAPDPGIGTARLAAAYASRSK